MQVIYYITRYVPSFIGKGENSMEIVKSIADELGESPNGVRMILTKAGVYVKKAPASGSAKKHLLQLAALVSTKLRLRKL